MLTQKPRMLKNTPMEPTAGVASPGASRSEPHGFANASVHDQHLQGGGKSAKTHGHRATMHHEAIGTGYERPGRP